MTVSIPVRCEGCCGCADVVHERFAPPHWYVEPELVRLVMVSEAPPLDPDDWFDAGDGALFAQTTILAFQESGASVATLDDLVRMGVYLTTAVKCAKATSVISARTITTCSSLLEAELALFPDVRALMLMGDAAIKSINAIARRRGEPRVIPAGSTYKLRGGRYVWPDAGLPVVRAVRPCILRGEEQPADDRGGHRGRARAYPQLGPPPNARTVLLTI